MFYGRNSNIPNNKMSRISRIENSDTLKWKAYEITAMESAIAASIEIKNNGGWKREAEDRLKAFLTLRS